MKKIILIIAIFSLMPVVTALSTLETYPRATQITKGETFTVSIYVKTDTPIDTIAINYTHWDPTVAEFVKIEPGDFMVDPIVSIMGTSIESGLIKDIVLAKSPAGRYEGTVATITFKALKAGEFGIYIPEVAMAKAGYDVETTTSIISYEPPPGVEPPPQTNPSTPPTQEPPVQEPTDEPTEEPQEEPNTVEQSKLPIHIDSGNYLWLLAILIGTICVAVIGLKKVKEK